MEYFKGKSFWLIKSFPCNSRYDIRRTVFNILKRSNVVNQDKDSMILVKPNLNNDIPGILGGTTDLRILFDVLFFLKQNGFKNVIIGDGPNVGMFHSKIDVFCRLGITKIADNFGYEILDFNNADYKEINLLGRRIRVARICLESDFFINLPKIKTHTEALLSICLKNMIGCLVGYDKRKIHLNFFDSRIDFFNRIIELNKILMPDLHIVDGLVIMEGDGPSAGTPRRLGLILGGNNPFVLDSVCSKLIGINPLDVPYLRLAFEKNLIPKDSFKMLFTLKPLINIRVPRIMSRILANVFLRNFFIRLRYKMDFIFSNKVIDYLLVKTKIRQEQFSKKELVVKRIFLKEQNCNNCRLCINSCPLNIDIPNLVFVEDCLKCMYCFISCPHNAISYDGQLGFLENYLTRVTKCIHKKK